MKQRDGGDAGGVLHGYRDAIFEFGDAAYGDGLAGGNSLGDLDQTSLASRSGLHLALVCLAVLDDEQFGDTGEGDQRFLRYDEGAVVLACDHSGVGEEAGLQVMVVVVDDDARIRDLLRRYLTQEGFEVLLAEDAKALNRLLTRETIDLIVLDLMLPGEDGLSICRRLRAANDSTPIIMLTAKVEDVDRIVGLEVGADDYLPKPFNPRELLARIHAVLRRRPAMEAPGAPSKDQQTVSFGPFVFDLSLRRLTKDGEQMALTTGEFSMLKALVRHPRQPLSRDKLAQLARGREFEPFDRSLDVQISRLRKMIEPDPAQPRYIQTVWGVGYVFVPDGTS